MHYAEQEKLLFGGGVSSQGLDKASDHMQPGVDGRELWEGLPSDRQTPLTSANQIRLLVRPT